MQIRQPDGTLKEVSRVIPNYKQRKLTENDKITNERQLVIKEFLERLNSERDGVKFKKLSPAAVAVKLGHLNLQDLYFFLSVCKKAKSFGSTFWYLLKTGEETGKKSLFQTPQD